jgi:hypothetical protein
MVAATPNGQGADSLDDVPVVRGFQIKLFPGQKTLVQDAYLVVLPADAAVRDHRDSPV